MSAELVTVAKRKEKPEVAPVDCRNDSQMVKEGLRLPLFVQNPEWHKKTPHEKAELELFSKIKGYRASAPAKTRRTCPHTITVHLKNLKKEPSYKTTYSAKLYQDQVFEYLDMYFGNKRDEVRVVYFHGKKVSFGE